MMWMTARRFDWALQTRGTAVRDWPAAERRAALTLLRRSEAARLLLADMLAAEDGFEPDPAALLRMQGTVRRAVSPPAPVLRGIRWGAIAACVAAGLYLGIPRVETDVAAAGDANSALGPTVQMASPATVLAALDD